MYRALILAATSTAVLATAVRADWQAASKKYCASASPAYCREFQGRAHYYDDACANESNEARVMVDELRSGVPPSQVRDDNRNFDILTVNGSRAVLQAALSYVQNGGRDAYQFGQTWYKSCEDVLYDRIKSAVEKGG